MKIERLELIQLRLPLVAPFETSFGRVEEKETVVVRASAQGLDGWGECPAAGQPDYSYETVRTVWHVIRDFMAPRLKGAELFTPGPIADLFGNVRGHPMAKAGLEMAVNDLLARKEGRPLWKMLGGQRKEIPAGISLGIQEHPEKLITRIGEAVVTGYQRIKMKIKPGWDVEAVRRVREAFPDLKLMVDANAAYTLKDADHLARLDEYDLMMIEQPLEIDDLFDHADLQKKIRTPVCLDESIRSWRDARRGLEGGACRIINIKQARVGGMFAAKAIHNVAKAAGADVWCGGLLESGIGRLHNIALATLPGFTLPGDISASERYYREDVVEPPVTLTSRGTIAVPDLPGAGIRVNETTLSRYAVRREELIP